MNIHAAMAQAVKDAGKAIPVVAHRRNRGAWLVTLRAEDLERLVEAVLTAKSKSGSVVVDALRHIIDSGKATPQIHPSHCPACDGDGLEMDRVGGDPYPCKACKGTGKR